MENGFVVVDADLLYDVSFALDNLLLGAQVCQYFNVICVQYESRQVFGVGCP